MTSPHPHHSSLSTQLQVLATALGNSLKLIYLNHTIEIKILLLVLFAYVAFKVGRATVTDAIDKQVKNISKVLRYREHYTIYLPQKVKSIAKMRFIILIVVFMIVLVAGILYYLQHKLIHGRSIQQLQAGGLLVGFIFVIIIVMWCYQKVLSLIMRKGGYNDILIHQKIAEIVTSFGKKTQFLLKSYLCKQKFRNHKSPPVGVCHKEKCKNYRELLRQKTQVYSTMVDSVLNFDWCSICRRRAPFDEHLLFQSKHYQKNPDLSEQDQVKERNRYLLAELERMCQWIERVGPCNCSKRYWLESTKEIIEFKRQDKSLNQELAKYEIKQTK